MTLSSSLSSDSLQWNKSQKSAKPKRILNPISPGGTSQGQGSKDAADSSRSEKLDDLRVSIAGSTKERVCPLLQVFYFPNCLCTSLLDGIILQQAWKKKIEEAGAEFHANVKKGTY